MRNLIAFGVVLALIQPVAASEWCSKPMEEGMAENLAPPGMTATLENGVLTVGGERCSPAAEATDFHCPELARSLWPDWPYDEFFIMDNGLSNELWLTPDRMIHSELKFIPCPEPDAIS
jgi:hypothetical protein